MPAAPARLGKNSVPTDHVSRGAGAGFTVFLAGFGLVVIAGVVIGSRLGDVPISILIQDPTTVLRGHPLMGALSSLGVLLWTATVSICGLTLWARGDLLRRMDAFEYVAGGALLTSVLLVDDLFMVHEYLAPRLLGLRGDRGVLATYAGLTAIYFWRIRRQLSIRDHLLVAACTFFAISVGLDQFATNKESPWYSLWEDGPKFLGILSWFGHYALLCRGLLGFPGSEEIAEETRA